MDGKLPENQNLEETIEQLQSSGVLFCIQYVGSVVVEKSINSLSAERQTEVARACMRFVVRKALPSLELSGHDEELSSTYVHGPVQPHQKDVEMNISATAIILIDTISMRPLHRFKIQDVSLLSPGFQELSSFFCFFAKVQVPGQPLQWLRKCFVFNAHTEMEDVRDAICFAFRLNEHNNNNNNGPKRGSNSGQFMEESGTIGREDAETPVPPSTPPTPMCRDLASPSAGSAKIPEIRISDNPANRREREVATPPEVPPRPRRYTSGNVMESKQRVENGGLSPMGRLAAQSGLPGRSGTMDASSAGQRSSSISPREDISIVQITPERYKELTRDLQSYGWFHGVLSRLKADSMIRANGQFLIRQSPNMADQFVLVGMHDGTVRHVCLVNKDGKIQTTIGEFKSIVDLIKYFHHTRTPMMLFGQLGQQLQLQNPVNREQQSAS